MLEGPNAVIVGSQQSTPSLPVIVQDRHGEAIELKYLLFALTGRRWCVAAPCSARQFVELSLVRYDLLRAFG
jgi:hypothetical protein